MIEATDATFANEVATGAVLLDFWAPWCGPCRAQTPILEAIAAKQSKVKIVKVNVDDCPETAKLYKVRSIPTLILTIDGAQKYQSVGLHDEGTIDSLFKNHIEG